MMNAQDTHILKTANYIEWKCFHNKTVYVTGATGLIGSNCVKALLTCTEAHIVVQVRNEIKARSMFGNKVEYVVCDLRKMPTYAGTVDYIIHCANPTSSSFFINKPVETIDTAINGTKNILDFARNKGIASFVFLSTMEVYGFPAKGHKVKECEGGNFDSTIVRNCYPLSKQLCENLCVAYLSEYDIPAKVLRLTQTFGPGVDYNDGRVFAEFARCAIEKKNIILKTKGETERSYLYTTDAVLAIFAVLLYGENGEAYTAANENTFCTIYNMAQMVATMSGIEVVIKEGNTSQMGYANTLHMDLDTTKLQNLGWKATVTLKEMYKSLIDFMIKNKYNGQ